MKLSLRPFIVVSLMSSILFGVACSKQIPSGKWSFSDGSWTSMEWFSEKLVLERTEKIENKMNMQSAPLLKSISAEIDNDYAELSGQDSEKVKGSTVCVLKINNLEFAKDTREIDVLKSELKLNKQSIAKIEQELDRLGDEKNRSVIKVSEELISTVPYEFGTKMICTIDNDIHKIVLESESVPSSAQIRFYQAYTLGTYDFTRWRSLNERELNLKEIRHNANLDKAEMSSITLLDISYQGLNYLDLNGLYTDQNEHEALLHHELCTKKAWQPKDPKLCDKSNAKMQLAVETKPEYFYDKDHMKIMSNEDADQSHKLDQFFGDSVHVNVDQFLSHLELDSYLIEVNTNEIKKKYKNSRILK